MPSLLNLIGKLPSVMIHFHKCALGWDGGIPINAISDAFLYLAVLPDTILCTIQKTFLNSGFVENYGSLILKMTNVLYFVLSQILKIAFYSLPLEAFSTAI